MILSEWMTEVCELSGWERPVKDSKLYNILEIIYGETREGNIHRHPSLPKEVAGELIDTYTKENGGYDPVDMQCKLLEAYTEFEIEKKEGK